MTQKPRIRDNFHVLLVALSLLVLTRGFVPPGLAGRIWMHAVVAAVLASGVFAFIRRRRVRTMGLVLALTTAAVTVIALLAPARGWAIARQSLLALFLLFMAGVLLDAVLRRGRITAEKLSGSVCVYLLIGAIWAALFHITELAAPGSIRFPETDAIAVEDALQSGEPNGTMIYFSFVTLTTLGYGDIMPVSRAARSLAWAEALVGQLYLTILVARLVGMYLTGTGMARDE